MRGVTAVADRTEMRNLGGGGGRRTAARSDAG